MRPLSSGRTLVLAAAAALLVTGATLPAVADPDGDGGTPSQAEVDQARDAVAGKRRTVAAVRTDLMLANQRLERAAIRAAQATEAWNAARWQLGEAESAVRAADRRADHASRRLAAEEARYGELIAMTYESAPELNALSAVVDSDGMDEVVETENATYQLTTSVDDIRDAYDAAVVLADLAGERAEEAREDAADLAKKAADARAEAQGQADAAAAEADAVTRQKDRLIAELARLQNISVGLAARRQAALEAAAQQAAAEAAEQEQQEQQSAPPAQPDPPQQPANDPTDDPAPAPANDPEPTPEPQPDPTPPPPSTSGAERAIAFARAQMGEPYVWGAAGPNAWDCSGLTMEAWRAGGTSLPHYSVGQYGAATPIRAGDLRPGDLVFWGSSGDPGSIYHVALYIGGGRIIHAPRTGRPVTEDSMYYWIPPNFYARP